MSTPTTSAPDDQLRSLVARADPLDGEPGTAPPHLWQRVTDALTDAPASTVGAERTLADAASKDRPAAPRRSFARRHWQAGLLAAAGVATVALAAGTILPGLSGGSDASTSATGVATADEGQAPTASSPDSAEAPARNGLQSGTAAGATGAASDASGATANAADPTLVRSASVVVGTDDVQGGRDRFVAQIEGMGGTLVSETVTSRPDMPVSSDRASTDIAGTYPYPYPSGPGIWLTVKVPAASYDEAVAAARATGDVVQLQQSSYDVGAQVTDVRARIAVLTASLKRLEGLLDEANSVSDVIRLEDAIAQRQAELDSLLAQQRELADQTQMAQVSLTLMSPDDAEQLVDPEPQLTWWESFVRGLSQFWSWLGQALLVLSPLLIVAAILLWVRRRRGRPGRTGTVEENVEAP